MELPRWLRDENNPVASTGDSRDWVLFLSREDPLAKEVKDPYAENYKT